MFRIAAAVGLALVSIAACSGSDDGDRDDNQLLRIDGPATVDEDVVIGQD